MQQQSACLAPKTIIMLGTAPGMMGGVSSVIDIYIAQGLLERWNICYIVTHADGGALTKARVALAAIGRFLAAFLWHRPRILHVHVSPYTSFWRKFIFVRIAQARGCRVILHLHGDNFDVFHRNSPPLLQRMIGKAIARSALIIALSEEWQSIALFKRLAPAVRIACVANPVVIPKPVHQNSQPGQRLLFLGKLAVSKGVFDLIHAFANISPRVPDAKLQLGGNGDIDQARRLVAELGLQDRVEILGWVQGARKDALLRDAAAYVLPSYNEGLPMGVLEAMAHGLPVVATTVGGIPGAVRDGIEGILVTPGDVAQLSEALLRITSAPALAKSMGEAGRRRAEAIYSAPVIMARLDDIYNGLLENTKAPDDKLESA